MLVSLTIMRDAYCDIQCCDVVGCWSRSELWLNGGSEPYSYIEHYTVSQKKPEPLDFQITTVTLTPYQNFFGTKNNKFSPYLITHSFCET